MPQLTTIACLPVAGPDNPYQHLMMDGLNRQHLRAFNGVHDKLWGIARTVLRYRPHYLHFDWIVSYYYRRQPWLTYLSVVSFCLQILLARLLGVRLVWTLHNLLPHDLPLTGIHRFCQRFLARRCVWVRVFAPGTVAKAAAELQIPGDRFRVVPEGDYTQVYPHAITQQEARQRLNLPPSHRVLLSLGLIKPYKGIVELVQAFNQLSSPDTSLVIAGKIMDKPYGERVKAELTNATQLIDQFIPKEDLQIYFAAADAVVLPFQAIENSGSVIMAMGFSKVIVAPRRGVVQERLQQQDEWLYDTPGEMAQKLRNLTKVPTPALIETGNRNFAALKKYSWEDFALLFI